MLDTEFQRIKESHLEALKKITSRVVLGPSVVRVYTSGTKQPLMRVLSEIDIDTLLTIADQKTFSKWFNSHVARIARVIVRCNPNNPRIAPGIKWGHATKILSIFVRDLVLRSRYFSDREAERISYFLYVPIDGVVIRRLRELGVRLPFSKIKEIDSQQKFYDVQAILEMAAKKRDIPRVWFDDVWGDRQ